MSVINFSGLASGIDSTALIKALTDATRKQRVTPNETKVEELTDSNDKLGELKTMLSDLKTNAQGFSTLAGGALSKLATSSNEAFASATAAKSASNGSYSITVAQRARNATHSFDDRFAATTTPINTNINNSDPAVDRTVTYTIGTGTNEEEIEVVVTNTMTADEFVTQFNSQATKAVASLVNMGTAATPSYAIVVNSVNEGTEKGDISVAVGARITDPNNDASTADGAFVTATQSTAQNAQFSVTGITGTITRSTNSVSDVIPGITLTLNDIGTSVITVSDDSDATLSVMEDFIEKFNEIVNFIKENNLVSREEAGSDVKNVFSPLAKTRVDDNALTALRSAISGATYASGAQVRIFSDLGITTERDGTLKFDSAVFRTAISNEAASANQVLKNFADEASLTGGTIDVFIRFQGLLDVTVDGNTTLITDLNKRIATAEAFITRQEENMRARFARLESTVAKMQAQQNALTSALAGLG